MEQSEDSKPNDPPSSPEPPSKPEVRVQVNRCPHCHDDVAAEESDWVSCRACLTRHHDACWHDLGRCGACGGEGALGPVELATAASGPTGKTPGAAESQTDSTSKVATKASTTPSYQGENKRSFRALVGAQFFGAFNDNLFKQLLLFLAARSLFPGEDKQGLAFAIFALPFVVFSGIAGDLSERLSKQRIVVAMKAFEVVIMFAGAVALHLRSWNLMLATLFVMGFQSAIFGPAKYGIIPELVPPGRLLRANASIAMTTYLAILLGQALAGPLLDYFPERLWVSGVACIGFAAVGTLLSLLMAPLPPTRPDLKLPKNPFGSLFQTIRTLHVDHRLMGLVLFYSLLWFDAGVLQQAITGLGDPEVLNIGDGENRVISMLLINLAVSIMVGSWLVSRLAKRGRPGLYAFGGALAMAAGQFGLLSVGSVFPREHYGLLVAHLLLSWIGLAGACIIVPVQSYLQHGPPEGTRGKTFAVNNFMNFVCIFLAGIWYLIAMDKSVALGAPLTQALASLVLLGAALGARKQLARMTFEAA